MVNPRKRSKGLVPKNQLELKKQLQEARAELERLEQQSELADIETDANLPPKTNGKYEIQFVYGIHKSCALHSEQRLS